MTTNNTNLSQISHVVGALMEAADQHQKDPTRPFDPKLIIRQASAKTKAAGHPKVVEILAALPEDYKKYLSPFLKVKPVRTASGVAVVAVMCKPHRCPHIAMTGNICV